MLQCNIKTASEKSYVTLNFATEPIYQYLLIDILWELNLRENKNQFDYVCSYLVFLAWNQLLFSILPRKKDKASNF